MDVGVFHPLAQAYRRQLEAHTRYTGAEYSINKVDFILLYQKAREIALHSNNIRSAWAKSGLFPLNPATVYENLPTVAIEESRSITSSGITLTSSVGNSFSLAFTPANTLEVDSLIEQIANQSASKKQIALKQLAKRCKSSFAIEFLLQKTNEELLGAASKQETRSKRSKGNYGGARVMNLEVIAQREQNKQSKEADKEYQQALKDMRRAALATIFLNSRKFSPRKPSPTRSDPTRSDSTRSSPTRSDPTKQASSGPIFPPPIISMGSASSELVKRHQKRARILNKPIEQAKETASVIQTSRSERAIKPSLKMKN